MCWLETASLHVSPHCIFFCNRDNSSIITENKGYIEILSFLLFIERNRAENAVFHYFLLVVCFAVLERRKLQLCCLNMHSHVFQLFFSLFPVMPLKSLLFHKNWSPYKPCLHTFNSDIKLWKSKLRSGKKFNHILEPLVLRNNICRSLRVTFGSH